jgi:hypothetical protein
MFMENYKQMYLTLFRKVTYVISLLQKVQQETEEMYISIIEEENENDLHLKLNGALSQTGFEEISNDLIDMQK